MIRIILDHTKGFTWTRSKDFYCIGTLNEEEIQLIQGSVTDDIFKTRQNLVANLKKIQSFFTAIIDMPLHIIVVMDHIASFPLFYSLHDRCLTIADSAYPCSLTHKGDSLGIAEYKSTMSTIGTRTVWENVKSVRNGSLLIVEKATLKTQEISYWKYRRQFGAHPTNAASIDEIVTRTFMRATETLRGKTVILPITAGLDSRTVAIFLKEFGHNDIISFSIGKEGTEDVEMGRVVARKLGIPWNHVDISASEWAAYLSSVNYEKSIMYCFGGGRTLHLLMASALKKLTYKSIIPQNAVFVPGHAGCMMGGELKRITIPRKNRSTSWVVDSIANNEMALEFLSRSENERVRADYRGEISGYEPNKSNWSPDEYLAIADTLHVNDYILKFIVNDVKNYEYEDFTWYLPLMDKEWCDFWALMPRESSLYKKALAEFVNGKTTGILDPYQLPSHRSRPVEAIKMYPRCTALARRLVWYERGLRSKTNEAGCFDGYSISEYKALLKKYPGTNILINSMIINDSLELLRSNQKLI